MKSLTVVKTKHLTLIENAFQGSFCLCPLRTLHLSRSNILSIIDQVQSRDGHGTSQEWSKVQYIYNSFLKIRHVIFQIRKISILRKSTKNPSDLIFNHGFRNDIGNDIDILTPLLPQRQMVAFRPVRRDCARLRDRIMSWIVSKRRTSLF